MMTTLLFPGQGSQESGMGGGLFGRVSGLVADADAILGYSVEELCMDESGRLDQTCFTQPALFVVSCLMYEQWRADGGGEAAFAAGHSVGEYAALYAAGSIDFATGVRMVQKRGELMHRQAGGGMAAVIGMDLSGVKKVLSESDLSRIDIANLNAPEQIIVSGMQVDIEAAERFFIDAGAKRYILLKVSGAFHSRYMAEIAEEYRSFIADVEFAEPAFPVISNLDAQPYNMARAQDILVAQIYSSVRWTETILYLQGQGDMEFLELGPGKVLSRLLRRIR